MLHRKCIFFVSINMDLDLANNLRRVWKLTGSLESIQSCNSMRASTTKWENCAQFLTFRLH